MWAGCLVLRIGERRDLLVAIRVDSESTLDRLNILFERWVETSPDESTTHKPAFSIRLAPVETSGRGRRGAQLVPQLRCGSCVMARARDADEVLRSLARVLGGAHEHDPDDGQTWLSMRAFSNGRSAVLTDLNRPAMVNDRVLEQAGVHELAVWSVALKADGSVVIPPPLSDLAWDAIAVTPPAELRAPLQLRGIVLVSDHDLTMAERLAGVGGQVIDGEWFGTVSSVASTGALTGVADQRALRDHIRATLRSTELSE